jgi:hypothetical protein
VLTQLKAGKDMYVSGTQNPYYQTTYMTQTRQTAVDEAQGSKQSSPNTNAANIAPPVATSSSSKTSSEINAALLALQEVQTSEQTTATTEMVTSKGNIPLNLDEYFANTPQKPVANLMDVPLLMPSAQNIQALSNHVSGRFSQMLSDYDIPEAPAEITYDREGKIHFPDDYAYSEQLTQALEENPGIARELSTINALTSHYVEIQKRMPMIEEMQKANSQADIDSILAKYQDLITDNGSYSSIALNFNKEGNIVPMADGKAVQFA